MQEIIYHANSELLCAVSEVCYIVVGSVKSWKQSLVIRNFINCIRNEKMPNHTSIKTSKSWPWSFTNLVSKKLAFSFLSKQVGYAILYEAMVELFVRKFYCGEGCMKLGHGSSNYTGIISTEIPNQTLWNVKEINAYRLAVCSVFCQYYYRQILKSEFLQPHKLCN